LNAPSAAAEIDGDRRDMHQEHGIMEMMLIPA
jgi:hypothetical protein